MTKNIDHERCSEQLRAFIRRELDEDETRVVEEHLDSCDTCRAELLGLKALLGAEDPGLDLRERRTLHEGVARAIEAREPVILGAGLEKKRGWMQRFAPTLSAAALLLVVLVVAASGLTGNGDGDGAASDAAGGAKSGPSGNRSRGEEDAALEEAIEDDDAGEGEAAAPDKQEFKSKNRAVETGSALRNGPRPSFIERFGGDLAAAAPPDLLEDFASSYTVADAEKREFRYIALLSRTAPSQVRGQVQDCGDVVTDASEEPVLAASGALGRVDDRPGLFLSFVYSDAERGPLSSYMVWAWPRGSCSKRLAYRTGTIDE